MPTFDVIGGAPKAVPHFQVAVNGQLSVAAARFCKHILLGAVLPLASVVLPGCSGAGDTTAVQGKVTYNGKSVTNGVINFRTQGAPPKGGVIKPDGTYSYDLPPGQYQVRIDTAPAMPTGWKEGDPPPKLPPRQVPEKYASYGTSGLTANITGEEDPQTVDFTLP